MRKLEKSFMKQPLMAGVSALIFFLFIPFMGYSQIDSEENFYTAPTSFNVIENLVDDYGVDNSFDTDDSYKLKQAISYISSQGGGKLNT